MAERLRFYLDEHVDSAVAEGLRRRGVDVVRVQEVGLLSATDPQHLAFATREARVIFTQDADFLRLHAANQSHPGIIYAPQHTSIGSIVRGLMRLYELMDAEAMHNHIEFL